MFHTSFFVMPLILAMTILCSPAIAGLRAAIVQETVSLAAQRSGRELVEGSARESTERAVAAAVERFGPSATAVIADGGLELLEASARYGDDVMRVAMEVSPSARRLLGLDPGTLLPLVRELGSEAIELEAKAPGLARRIFSTFGAADVRQLVRTTPADDLPRLLAFAERSDTPQTRKLLLNAYSREGASLFRRIPPSLVLAGGLSGAMLYGTHRLTQPVAEVAAQINRDPEIARTAMRWIFIVFGLATTLLAVVLLRAIGLFRSHRQRPREFQAGEDQPLLQVRAVAH